MATDAEMVVIIKAALHTQPGGTVSVSVDGQSVQWNRKDLRDELTYWEARAARAKRRLGRISTIRQGGIY